MKINSKFFFVSSQSKRDGARTNGGTVNITHILREENQLVDHLTNTILDNREIDVESFEVLRVQENW